MTRLDRARRETRLAGKGANDETLKTILRNSLDLYEHLLSQCNTPGVEIQVIKIFNKLVNGESLTTEKG